MLKLHWIAIPSLMILLTIQRPAVPAIEIPAASTSALYWSRTCLDCLKDFIKPSDRILRLDINGQPRIAYGGDHLYYAWKSGTTWQIETVDENPAVGAYASMALDQAGNPHISYYDATTNALKYAYRIAGQWFTQTVATGDNYTQLGDSSIAIASTGYPAIAYQASTYFTGYLKYAQWNGTSWSIQDINYSATLLVQGISLAFGPNDRPQLAYYNIYTFENRLKYAYRLDAVNWHYEDVERIGGGGQYPSLALDSLGRPHISYTTQFAGDALKYAHWNGSSWSFSIVDRASGAYTSMALDRADRPRIAYNVYMNDGDLRYASWNGSSWSIQTADGRGIAAASLALDSSDNPQIAFLEPEALSVTRWTGSAWEYQRVDSGYSSYGMSSIGRDNSLALGPGGLPQVSYHNNMHYRLKYARWSGSAWQVQNPVGDPTSGGDTGFNTSLALDSAGNPHISYKGRYNECGNIFLGYVDWNGSQWIPIVADENLGNSGCGGMVPGNTSLALDSTGRPRILYSSYDNSTFTLKLAGWSGSGWNSEVVAQNVGERYSLVLDKSDQPHITYSRPSINGLIYSRWNGSAWITQTIDAASSPNWVVLALDSSDRPYIAYNHRQGTIFTWSAYLKLAFWSGSDWVVQTVDTQTNTAFAHLSLALNTANHPRISYVVQGRLSYAAWNGSSWETHTLDSINQAADNSLALNSAGYARLSYFDTSNGDLKYADQILPPLTLSKQASPLTNLRAGDTVTFTLTLGSPGITASLSDPLPTGLIYVPGSLSGSVSPQPSHNPIQNAIVWQGLLAEGAPQTITFQARLASGLVGTPVLINTAWITDTENNRSLSAIAIVNANRICLPIVYR